MKPRTLILVNRLEEFDFENKLNHYLPPDRFDVAVADSFPEDATKFDLIFPFNYRKIIKGASLAGNVIVMHASELPEGRGWAPIYYAFSKNKNEYVVSGIFAAEDFDSGDIIIRARIKIAPGYTARFIRAIDKEIFLLLIAKIFEQWPKGKPTGIKQTGSPSCHPRRYPKDNEIDIKKPLIDLISHLRGTEPQHPAFFFYEGEKYLIEITPELVPKKPCQVTIEYPSINRIKIEEVWCDS